jgi:hypothetical protein
MKNQNIYKTMKKDSTHNHNNLVYTYFRKTTKIKTSINLDRKFIVERNTIILNEYISNCQFYRKSTL